MILLDQAGAGANGSILLPPSRDRAPFIEHLWIQRARSSEVGRNWRIIPDANPYLIFAVSTTASRLRRQCMLVGPRTRFTDVSMADRTFTCGARLHPGALALLTRFPASDFTDRSIPVEDVFGASGKLLAEQLEESSSPVVAVRRLSNFLSHQWPRASLIPRFPPGLHARVEEMAARANLPVRTLHSRVMQHVGISPKRMIRIQRLHHALISAQAPCAAWADIAASSGFADQAHMIRDFNDLLGESPIAWRRRARLPICSRP